MLVTEACRPPRCTIPTCYVRMKHRHGGENWKDAPPPPKDFELETGATNIAEKGNKGKDNDEENAGGNRGTEYRGVRWWKKNKNPKIGEGYKPGYKYDYKKPKYKSRNSRKDRDAAPEGEEQIGDQQNAAPDSTGVQPEKKKGFFNKLRSKKSKKSEEPQLEEETQEEPPAKPDKKAPAEKKDGF
jgi:hypothetical protein